MRKPAFRDYWYSPMFNLLFFVPKIKSWEPYGNIPTSMGGDGAELLTRNDFRVRSQRDHRFMHLIFTKRSGTPPVSADKKTLL